MGTKRKFENSGLSVFNKLVDLTVNQLLLSRSSYYTSTLLDGANRNLNKECGYPEGEPTVEMYREMYERNDVANRVVSVYPSESWSAPPVVFETEKDRKTAFERALDNLIFKHNPWHYLERADELSGIGSYGIVVYGIGDGLPLDQPARGIRRDGTLDAEYLKTQKRSPVELLYMRPYPEYLVEVDSVEEDPNNPRYGQPTMYTVTTMDPRDTENTANVQATLDVDVHWTRVQHIADNCGASEIRGMPRQKPVFNRLLDVRKTTGSSAEMYYKGAFPGISFETFPELTNEAEVDSESLKEEIEAYSNGLRRYMRLIGMTAKSLAPQVADPQNHVMTQLQLICATIKVPLPVFLGNEAAHLASAQNMTMWTRRLTKRLNNFVTPKLVKGFVDRMMGYQVLPYVDRYQVEWRDLNVLGDLDRSRVSLQKSQSLLQYVTSGAYILVPPSMFLQRVLEFTAEETAAILAAAGGEQAIVATLRETLQRPNAQNAQTDQTRSRNALG